MYSRLDRIDGLRGLAIYGVIAIHSGLLISKNYPILNVKELMILGKYGVQLFFLISGFILCYVKDKSSYSYQEFYLKRFFRLAPLYYLVILICFLLNYNEMGAPLKARNFIYHILFIHGLFPDYLRSVFSVCWSLTPEVVFYSLFPFLYRFNNIGLMFTFLITLVTASFAGNISLFMFKENNEWIQIWTHCSPLANTFLFIFGMLVYKNKVFFKKNIWLVLGSFSIILSIFVDKNFLDNIFYDGYFGLLMLTFPMLVYSQNRIINFLLENNFITSLGKISYSAFFIHYAIITACKIYSIKMPYLIILPIVLYLTYKLSKLSYKYIEKPCIKLGNNFISKLENNNLFIKDKELTKS